MKILPDDLKMPANPCGTCSNRLGDDDCIESKRYCDLYNVYEGQQSIINQAKEVSDALIEDYTLYRHQLRWGIAPKQYKGETKPMSLSQFIKQQEEGKDARR